MFFSVCSVCHLKSLWFNSLGVRTLYKLCFIWLHCWNNSWILVFTTDMYIVLLMFLAIKWFDLIWFDLTWSFCSESKKGEILPRRRSLLWIPLWNHRICEITDKKLFKRIIAEPEGNWDDNMDHVLKHLLPPKKTQRAIELRPRGHNYEPPNKNKYLTINSNNFLTRMLYSCSKVDIDP